MDDPKVEELSPKDKEVFERQGKIIADKYHQYLVPVNSIKHNQYYCILVQGSSGQEIYASGKIPLFFHRDVFDFARQLSLEAKGKLERADKVYIKARKSGIQFMQVHMIVPRKKKMLSKKERLKRMMDEKRNNSDVPKVSEAGDVDMSSVQGGEHQSDEGRQTDNVQQLHSNDNVPSTEGSTKDT